MVAFPKALQEKLESEVPGCAIPRLPPSSPSSSSSAKSASTALEGEKHQAVAFAVHLMDEDTFCVGFCVPTPKGEGEAGTEVEAKAEAEGLSGVEGGNEKGKDLTFPSPSLSLSLSLSSPSPSPLDLLLMPRAPRRLGFGGCRPVCRAYWKLHEILIRTQLASATENSWRARAAGSQKGVEGEGEGKGKGKGGKEGLRGRGIVALDVGSAPGGWTQCLETFSKQTGWPLGEIIAVDPAEMQVGVERGTTSPKGTTKNEEPCKISITHIKCKIEAAIPTIKGLLDDGGKPGRVDLVVCDMNCAPLPLFEVAVLAPMSAGILSRGACLCLTLKTFCGGRRKAADERMELRKRLLDVGVTWIEELKTMANSATETTILCGF